MKHLSTRVPMIRRIIALFAIVLLLSGLSVPSTHASSGDPWYPANYTEQCSGSPCHTQFNSFPPFGGEYSVYAAFTYQGFGQPYPYGGVSTSFGLPSNTSTVAYSQTHSCGQYYVNADSIEVWCNYTINGYNQFGQLVSQNHDCPRIEEAWDGEYVIRDGC